jgi:photosystem II stability/assembly factor-like uncharacterized protein
MYRSEYWNQLQGLRQYRLIGMLIMCLAVSAMAWEAFTFPDGIMNAEAAGNVTFNTGGHLFMVGRVLENETWHSVFYRSLDHGETFAEMGRTAMPFCRQMAFTSDGIAYLAAFDSFTAGIGIYRSRDTCRTWERTYTGKFWSLCITARDDLYALGTVEADSGVYRSTDEGENWSRHFELTSSGTSKIYCHNGDDLYIPNWPNKSLYYSNNGAAWTVVAEEPSWYVRSFAKLQAFSEGDLVVECNNTMHRSTDNGTTWSQITLPRPPRTFAVVDSKRLLLGAVPESETACMMFISENNGDDWEEYNEGIPNEVTMMRSIAVGPDGYAYAFPLVWTGENTTGYRNYMGPSTVGAPVRVDESAASIQVRMNGTKTIRVAAGVPIGTIVVSDLRGQVVRTIHGGNMQRVRFDIGSISSGAYIMSIGMAGNKHIKSLLIP